MYIHILLCMEPDMNIRNEKQFIQNLVKFRKRKKWSQSQLAEETSLSQQAISSFENGKVSPTLPTLFKIINALELEVTLKER